MTLNVAFLGAGPRAQPYLQALARRPDVALVGVSDHDRRAAEQTAAGWGAEVFTDFEAMLQAAQPNLLWICVPPRMQADAIARAVDKQVPFFVDPPGALDFQRACRLAKQIQ